MYMGHEDLYCITDALPVKIIPLGVEARESVPLVGATEFVMLLVGAVLSVDTTTTLVPLVLQRTRL